VALAFTLLELLVVVAIIAILASLLLAGLTRAQQSAYSAVCKSNLRQMGIGLLLYVGDAEAYPPYEAEGIDPQGNPQWQMWFEYLEKYTGANWPPRNWPLTSPTNSPLPSVGGGLYACPAYNHRAGVYSYSRRSSAYGAYGYNWVGSDASGVLGLGLGGKTYVSAGTGNLPATRESQALHPSELIALGDSILYRGHLGWGLMGSADIGLIDVWTPQYRSPATPWVLAPASETGTLNRTRHNDRLNVLFCDGHVTAFRREELFNSHDETALKRWNNDNLPHTESLPSNLR